MIAGTVFTPGIAATEATLVAWLDKARPGERHAYHVGQLAIDRYPGQALLPAPLREELSRVADRAMALAAEGRVHLAQTRLDNSRTAYLAIKTAVSLNGLEQHR